MAENVVRTFLDRSVQLPSPATQGRYRLRIDVAYMPCLRENFAKMPYHALQCARAGINTTRTRVTLRVMTILGPHQFVPRYPALPQQHSEVHAIHAVHIPAPLGAQMT